MNLEIEKLKIEREELEKKVTDLKESLEDGKIQKIEVRDAEMQLYYMEHYFVHLDLRIKKCLRNSRI